MAKAVMKATPRTPRTTWPASYDAEARRAYLEGASPRFRKAFQGIGRAFKSAFPAARPTHMFDMPGWVVGIEWAPPPEMMRGTMDPFKFAIMMVEGKSGMTLHFWCPPKSGLLQREKVALEAAGFKVMVGCLRFSKKTEYPVAAIRRLINAAAR